MKILFISNVEPDPVGYGSARRAAMHLRVLREMGEVTLVLPPEGAAKYQERYPGFRVVDRGHTLLDIRKWRYNGSRSRVKKTIHALRQLNLVDGRALPQDVLRLKAELLDKFELVFAFRLHSALWLESIFGVRSGQVRVVDLDDIESIVFAKKLAGSKEQWWRQAKLRLELRWLRKTERRLAAQWSAVCLCSQIDSDRFYEATSVRPWIVPNAYAFESVTPERSNQRCALLFVGTFGYYPNAEGVQWFVEKAWPMVRSELGDEVELSLVGLNPTAAIESYGSLESIAVAGNVPSVAPYYEAANIVIAPLHAGSGTRIKLIEAAALGRAIVTTTLGCEGLGFVDGVHAEIADDPADFAQRIIALARDPARRASLAKAARIHAMQAFSAETVSETLTHNLRALITSGGVNPKASVT